MHVFIIVCAHTFVLPGTAATAALANIGAPIQPANACSNVTAANVALAAETSVTSSVCTRAQVVGTEHHVRILETPNTAVPAVPPRKNSKT
jgi:hypothetical protein